MRKSKKSKKFFLVIVAMLAFGCATNAFAQASQSALFVPLIGITSVPSPLALPGGPGEVTYNYAVKNFLKEVPLTDIQVVDDKCSPVKFLGGDDNHDSKLDFTETWRYSCVVKLSVTTDSVATATGTVNNITATHKANATVVVGSNNLAPLVSIVNTTKIALPLALPAGGGDITFTYKVTNPGAVALSNVTVTDDSCSDMSNQLGDTNANQLLDTNEVWIYSCTTNLKQTTTSTVHVAASANGLRATGEDSITITVDTPAVTPATNLFDVGISPVTGAGADFKIIAWIVLTCVLLVLIIFYLLTGKRKDEEIRK